MIPGRPAPTFTPGMRLRVVQQVRIGKRRWATEVVGTVEAESIRPIGGMEMGAKALYGQQPALRLRLEDGELTTVAVDENTRVEVLS